MDTADNASSHPESGDSSGRQEAAHPVTPSTPTANIFMGPGGLRAGWRFFLYLAMVVAGIVGMSMYSAHANKGAHHHGNVIWGMLIGELIFFVIAFVPAFFMSLLEKRSFGTYGLPLRFAFGKLFWSGTAWGIVSLSVLMFALRAFGVFTFGTLAVHGARALKFAVFYAVLFFFVGLTEEFLMRGYSQFTLAQGIGFWPAAVILSLAFGAVHLGNNGEAWIGIVGAVMIGLFFCLTLRRTGNLWFALGFHAAWDWAESFLYSVADSGQMAPGHLLNSSSHGSHWLSGGTVGPEGSVLIFILIPAIWLAFDRMYRETRYVVPSGN
jgi:membrane protease YdiL (CAAX protease family)